MHGLVLLKVQNFIFDKIVEVSSLITLFQELLAIKVVFYPLNKVNTGCLCTYVIVCNTSLNFRTTKFVFFPHYFKNFGLNWKTPSFHLKLISSITIKLFVIKYNVLLIVINSIKHIRFLKCRFCLFKQNSEATIRNIKF